jgi:SAM-dependent methyltransferase
VKKEELKNQLLRHLIDSGHSEGYSSFQIESLFDEEAFQRRIAAFLKIATPKSKNGKILVSGCSVGEELQALMDFGYENLFGTEIDDVYLEICKNRFPDKVEVAKVTGEKLPFPTAFFSAVFSAHIVEHTTNPRLYIQECLRCLKPGGLLYLEFPTRFNLIELHTRTISFEWMPLETRKSLLKFLSTYTPLQKYHLKFESVLNTLQPISKGMILRFAKSAGYKVRLEGRKRISGIERMTLRLIGTGSTP